MLYSSPALLLALSAGLRPVLAHDSPHSPRNIFKRVASPDDSWVQKVDWKNLLDWNKPENYKGIDWAAHPEWYTQGKSEVPGSGSSPPPSSPPPATGNGGPVVHVEQAVHNPPQSQSSQSSPSQSAPVSSPQQSQPSTSEAETTTQGNGKCGTTSAQCPPGCAMTVKFTSDSLPVAFTPGAGGHSTSQQTKDSCICMTGGSVRINVGTTDTAAHGTLIEGNAAGLNDNSFFDISYVEGYSYPVVCWNEQDPSRMSGSNIDLYSMGKCTSSSASKMGDVCVNDGYTKLAGGAGGSDCYKCSLPSVFFAPAAGAAYTYPYDDCPCASDHQAGMPYQSPMANGGALMCCVGPQCCANTMTHGGMTKKGNCNRPDCQPCQLGFSWGHCSTACSPGKDKRSYERVLQQHSLRKRQSTHHHHHSHNH